MQPGPKFFGPGTFCLRMERLTVKITFDMMCIK